MRIGIFSGTFDPVHRGHIAFALAALERANLDEVVLLSEAKPKRKQPVASYTHRFAMLKLAATDQRLVVDRFAIQRAGAEHTVPAILAELNGYYDHPEYAVLLGEDALRGIEAWDQDEASEMRQFLRDAALVVAGRGTIEATHVETKFSDVSSAKVRVKLAAGESTDDWLEPAVLSYIKEHGLYV